MTKWPRVSVPGHRAVVGGVDGRCRPVVARGARAGSAPGGAGRRSGSHARRSAELALSEHELVVARTELEALYDDLYVLQCAVDDVHADLAMVDEPTTHDLREALQWVLSAATPLRDRSVQPATPRTNARRTIRFDHIAS